MSCLLNRNEEGRITSVQTKDGKTSQLFSNIRRNIFVPSAEAAAQLTVISESLLDSPNIKRKNVQEYSTGEPKLFYKTPKGSTTESLEKALFAQEDGNIQGGILSEDGNSFAPLFQFDPRGGEKSSFLTDQVLEGVLSDKKVLKLDGTTTFQGKGNFSETRVGTAFIFKENAFQNGYGNVTVDTYTGEIVAELGNDLIVAEKDGVTFYLTEEEAKDRAKEFDNQEEIEGLLRQLDEDIFPIERKKTKSKSPSEKSLLISLNNFLENLGFSVTSLESYRKRYNTIYGKDPDIQALADITNRVVALGRGEAVEEDMTEEVAHIAIELYNDQNTIASAIAQAHLTEEYKEFSEYYRSKYSPFFEGVELEDQVRKEVLGKILAKQLLNRFSNTETNNEVKISLVEKLKNYWNTFKNFITQKVTPYHSNRLESINNKIIDSLLEQDTSKFTNKLKSGASFFYSAMSKEHQDISRSLQTAKTVIERSLQKQNKHNPDRFQLEKISDDMTEVTLVDSVNTIIGITDRKLNELERIITSLEEGEILSVEDENLASTVIENLVPTVKELRVSTKDLAVNLQADGDLGKKLKNNIHYLDKVVSNIVDRSSKVEPLIDKEKENRVKKLADISFKRENMSEEAYEKEMRRMEGGNKDKTTITKMFSLISESENPVLRLIHKSVHKMHTKVRMRFLKELGTDLEVIIKKGLQKYESAIIKRDNKGKSSYFVKGPLNWVKIEKYKQEGKVKIISELTGKKKEVVTKELEEKPLSEILNDDEKLLTEYQNNYREWVNAKKVRPNTEEYYKDKEEKFTKLKISEATQETLKNFSARSAEINRPFLTEDGRVDRSLMKPEDKDGLNRIKKEKAVIKSPVDQVYEIKPGLKVVRADKLSERDRTVLKDLHDIDVPIEYKGEVVLLAEGFDLDTLTEESRISLDMNNIALSYISEGIVGGEGISKAFMGRVKELEEEVEKGNLPKEAVAEWVFENATVGLSDEYYANLDGNVNYEDLVRIYLENIGDEDLHTRVSDSLERLVELNRLRKNILRQNKKLGSSLEIKIHGMDSSTRAKLLDIEEEISEQRSRISLPKEYRDSSTSLESELRISPEFYLMAEDKGMNSAEDLFDFALDHMTSTNRRRAETFKRALTDMLYGSKASLSKFHREFLEGLEDNGDINDSMTKEEFLLVAQNKYAERNLASYFKIFEPAGYNSTVKSLKRGEIKMSEFLEDSKQFENTIQGSSTLNISPDYTWTPSMENNKYLNPEYKKGEYFEQWGEEFYDHEDFFNYYGISAEDYRKLDSDDISSLVATKNKEEFEFLQRYMRIREQSLERLQDKDRVNKWQRVQISKSTFEKLVTSGSIKNPKQMVLDEVRDLTFDRVDEKIFGEEVAGQNAVQDDSIKAIPKYFQARLEDSSMISEGSLSSVLLDARESIVYQERKRTEKDTRALLHKVKKQTFVQAGASLTKKVSSKPGGVSNTYWQAREYVDNHLYGVQQSRPLYITVGGREIPMTKIISKIQKFSSVANLGYNIFVDLTGASTGFVNNVIDRYTKEYYHPTSVNRANSLSAKLTPKYVAELGKLDKNSELTKIFEMLGLEDPKERVAESKLKRGGRLAKESGFLMSRLSNLSIYPKVALAILNDYRYFNGEFMSFEMFVVRQRKDNPKITLKELDTKWKNISKESLYDHLDFTQKTLTFNERFEGKFDNPEDVFFELISDIGAKAQKVAMNADGVLNDSDRVAAQRDVLTNTLMQHRGWMPINLTRRFKKDFYNITTGRVEEGHYRTAMNLIRELYKSVRGTSDYDSFKEYAQSLDRFKKQNAKRVAIETAMFTAMMLLGFAILAGDDEDDTVAENMFQYIYLRTVSEFNSSTAIGILGSVTESVDSPIPSLNTFLMFNLFSTVPDMFSQNAAGENKFYKKLKKTTLLKRFDQYSNLQGQIETYRYYQDPTLLWLGTYSRKKED